VDPRWGQSCCVNTCEKCSRIRRRAARSVSDNADWTLGLGMHLFRQAERETLLSPFGFGWWPGWSRGSNTVKSRVGVASAERGELRSGRDRRRETTEWELPLASPRRSALRRRLLLKERRKSGPLSSNQQRLPASKGQSPVRARFNFSKVRLPGDAEFVAWARPQKFKTLIDLLKRPYPSDGAIPTEGRNLTLRRDLDIYGPSGAIVGRYPGWQLYTGPDGGDPWLLSKRFNEKGGIDKIEENCSSVVAKIISAYYHEFTGPQQGAEPEWLAYWDLDATYTTSVFRAYTWGYLESRVRDPKNWYDHFRREGETRKERRRFWWWHKVCKLHPHLVDGARAGDKGRKKLVYLMQRWPSGRFPATIAPAVYVVPTKHVRWTFYDLSLGPPGSARTWVSMETRARAHTPVKLKNRSSRSIRL